MGGHHTITSIVLFDGICNLCNHSVRFIFQRDPSAQFQFAHLQSDVAKQILRNHGILDIGETIVLISGNKAYTQSSAVLRISKKLHGGWPVLFLLIIIPKFIRDGIYNFVANRRYTWFGKRDECLVPEPGLIERFLE